MDPEGLAAEEGEGGREAREVRYEACYAPVAALVRWLVNPSDAAATAMINRDLGLDAPHRNAALQELLQVPHRTARPPLTTRAALADCSLPVTRHIAQFSWLSVNHTLVSLHRQA